MTRADLLADGLDGSRAWTLKLIADFDGEEWVFQPAPGAQHALWICGHLAVASDLLVTVRCLHRPALVSAGFSAHFQIGSNIPPAGEHTYPSVADVRTEMNRSHAAVLEQIRRLEDAQLDMPAYAGDGTAHPHYATVAGAIMHAARHEAFHAGQLAVLRRLLGKRFLR
jgi:hypothetical protein